MFAIAYATRPPLNVFVEPWNPHVALPFFVLFLVQVWLLATGSRWQAVGLVLTGSFLVQLHIGYAPLVAVTALWGFGLAVLDTRRGPAAAPPWRKVVGPVALVLVVMWSPAIIQQLTGREGNLGAMVRYFTDGQYQVAGVASSARRVRGPVPRPSSVARARGAARLGHRGGGPRRARVAARPAALVALGLFAAHRSGDRAAHRMVVLALVGALASILALSRVSIELFPYLTFWRVAVAAFLVGSVAWAVGGWLQVEQHTVTRRVRRRAPRGHRGELRGTHVRRHRTTRVDHHAHRDRARCPADRRAARTHRAPAAARPSPRRRFDAGRPRSGGVRCARSCRRPGASRRAILRTSSATTALPAPATWTGSGT